MKTEIVKISETTHIIKMSYAGETFTIGGIFSQHGAEQMKQKLDTTILKYRDEIKYNSRRRT